MDRKASPLEPVKRPPFSASGSYPQDTPSTDTRALLQRFPHLEKIHRAWGSLACRNLLNSLLWDTRDGERQGFPPEHARTIFSLLSEHDESYPQFYKELHGMGFAGDTQRPQLRR